MRSTSALLVLSTATLAWSARPLDGAAPSPTQQSERLSYWLLLERGGGW